MTGDAETSGKLLISGLRRSCTTALWEVFRGHPSVRAFDEPFHPSLWEGERDNSKATWSELTALWSQTPLELVPGVSPITPAEETKPGLTPSQAAYITILANADQHVVIDVVRCWNKMDGITGALPNVHIVQIVRSPVPWVLSHLTPSSIKNRQSFLMCKYRQTTALKRAKGYNTWKYEDIIENIIYNSPHLFREFNVDTDYLSRSPAYVKLLAFWWMANLRIFRSVVEMASNRYTFLLAEDFMRNPASVVCKLMAEIGLPSQTVDVSTIRAPKNNSLYSNSKWVSAFDAIGIPHSLLPAVDHDTSIAQSEFQARI